MLLNLISCGMVFFLHSLSRTFLESEESGKLAHEYICTEIELANVVHDYNFHIFQRNKNETQFGL